MNILIVDEDEVDRTNIQRLLMSSGDGFVVKETDSMECALALFDSTKFDIVLLGFSVLGLDSIESQIECKDRLGNSLTAIIVMSHSQDEALAIRCIREGAQDFIIKSEITEERLRRTIIYAQARFELDLRRYQNCNEKKFLEEKDSLTGLASREYFSKVLSIALNNAKLASLQVGLVLIDIDNFKLINDSMGYAAGDQALIYAGNKLQSILPEGTLVSRLGGDEFAYYFTCVDTFDNALNTIGQIIHLSSIPMIFEGEMKVSMNMSIGIALSENKNHGANELMRDAEIAMYRAKKRGGQQYCFFQESMQLQVRRRVDLENGLIRAIEENEFLLNYQPVYDHHGAHLWGFEVLLRWQNRGETVEPDEFIRVAEETKLIQPIGEWVIETAFAELAKWNRKLNSRLKIAINLSPVQLENEEIDEFIRIKLAEYDIDPSLVEFEITETALLDFSEVNISVVQRIASLGCEISLDDFGTGFSSFTGLQKLPISVVKIDRSIMPRDDTDHNNKKLFGALIAMIDHLEMVAVAEGVETDGQYHYCREIGVERLQGYYLHKATPLNDLVMQKLGCSSH